MTYRDFLNEITGDALFTSDNFKGAVTADEVLRDELPENLDKEIVLDNGSPRADEPRGFHPWVVLSTSGAVLLRESPDSPTADAEYWEVLRGAP